LEGAAVTQVKIKNVSHEFSTMPGVLEDTILLMMNLKQMRFKVFSNDPQKAILKVRGEKKVRGSDFVFPSQVELINKDCHIATLNSKSAELEMEITIEKGIGYSTRESRKKEKMEIGAIPLDAIFTPVKRISYKVENMRVGDRTDFDRLFLEIETDGTLSPESAFTKASEIIISHFSMLGDAFVAEVAAQEKAEETKAVRKEKKTTVKKTIKKKVGKKIKKKK
jgi:DNA-directed RNA polymerase subunit alpha